MSKRKSRKNLETIKKDREANKKFFTVTIIITVILIAILYMVFRNVMG